MKQLQEKLIELRTINDLTQKDIAEKIGVSASAIGFWENGINEPKATYIYKLADTFKVSADYLLGLEDDFGVRTSTPIGDDMTADEREMIKKIRLLPKESRNLIEQMIDTLSGTSASSVNKKQA